MNTYSHTMIGTLIYGYLKDEHGIQLDKERFLKGNVIPDCSYFAVVHPHFVKLSLGYIQEEVVSLSKAYLESALIGSDYSFRLGIICHYYADFFCYAHSSGYRQAVVNHLKYEHLLYEYFQNNYDDIGRMSFAVYDDVSTSANAINDKFKQLHAEYVGLDPAYDKDILYALKACSGTILSLVSCARRQKAAGSLESFCEAAAV